MQGKRTCDDVVACTGFAQMKRSKKIERVDMCALPDDVLIMIMLASVCSHGDLGMLKACCKSFYNLLRVDKFWKRVSMHSFGSREDIIAPPLIRSSEDETWEMYVASVLRAHRDKTLQVLQE